mgnify:CR=1 FL=1
MGVKVVDWISKLLQLLILVTLIVGVGVVYCVFTDESFSVVFSLSLKETVVLTSLKCTLDSWIVLILWWLTRYLIHYLWFASLVVNHVVLINRSPRQGNRLEYFRILAVAIVFQHLLLTHLSFALAVVVRGINLHLTAHIGAFGSQLSLVHILDLSIVPIWTLTVLSDYWIILKWLVRFVFLFKLSNLLSDHIVVLLFESHHLGSSLTCWSQMSCPLSWCLVCSTWSCGLAIIYVLIAIFWWFTS